MTVTAAREQTELDQFAKQDGSEHVLALLADVTNPEACEQVVDQTPSCALLPLPEMLRRFPHRLERSPCLSQQHARNQQRCQRAGPPPTEPGVDEEAQEGYGC